MNRTIALAAVLSLAACGGGEPGPIDGAWRPHDLLGWSCTPPVSFGGANECVAPAPFDVSPIGVSIDGASVAWELEAATVEHVGSIREQCVDVPADRDRGAYSLCHTLDPAGAVRANQIGTRITWGAGTLSECSCVAVLDLAE